MGVGTLFKALACLLWQPSLTKPASGQEALDNKPKPGILVLHPGLLHKPRRTGILVSDSGVKEQVLILQGHADL